jgi:hypothetical protein
MTFQTKKVIDPDSPSAIESSPSIDSPTAEEERLVKEEEAKILKSTPKK